MFRIEQVWIGLPKEWIGMDPIVAFDKLAQFKTADDIAKYLLSEDCYGHMQVEDQCPIAEFFHKYLQLRTVSVGTFISTEADWNFTEISKNFDLWEKPCTAPMQDFIQRFDNGHYPELIACSGQDFCICTHCISKEYDESGEEGE